MAAVTDDSVTIGGVTFVFAGAAAAGLEIGDEVCIAATTSPTGNPIITDVDVTDDEDDGAAPGTGDGDEVLLPDTAVGGPSPAAPIAALLALVAFAAATLRRVRQS